MKFRVGDEVVGNKFANKYGVTKENWVGKVKKVEGFGIFVIGDRIYDGVWVESNCFDLVHKRTPAQMLFMED